MAAIDKGITRAIENDTALHYVNAPNHMAAVIRNLAGHVKKLQSIATDDPLLFAYEVKGNLPYIANFVIDLQKTAEAIIDCTPDQLQEIGAQLCR